MAIPKISVKLALLATSLGFLIPVLFSLATYARLSSQLENRALEMGIYFKPDAYALQVSEIMHSSSAVSYSEEEPFELGSLGSDLRRRGLVVARASSSNDDNTKNGNSKDTKSSNGQNSAADSSSSSASLKKDGCTWNSTIEGTQTRPIWLVVGLSAGGIFGMMLAAYTSYNLGKVKALGGGGMGGGMGAMPPPPPAY